MEIPANLTDVHTVQENHYGAGKICYYSIHDTIKIYIHAIQNMQLQTKTDKTQNK